MAKTQLNARVDEDVAEAARQAAQTNRVTLNEYIESLIKADTGLVRARFVEAARAAMEESREVFADLGDGPSEDAGRNAA